MSTTVIVLIVVALIAMFLISIYNNLVRLRNNRENAFSNISVQLKQRYADHEKELLQKVTEARAAAMGANTINETIAADNKLSSALAGLRVSLEAYPDLKANSNFNNLQMEIADMENKLSATRRFFNSTTKELNTAIQSFPANLIAGMFGFTTQPMFEIPVEQQAAMEKAPEIKF